MVLFKRREAVEQCIIAGNQYEYYWLAREKDRKLSPLSKEIIRGISGPQKLFAILLMLTRLRYAELHLVNWSVWFDDQEQQVYQPKVKAKRTLNGIGASKDVSPILDDPSEHLEVLNYKSLRRAIKKALPTTVKTTLSGCRLHTHVFRHLETSYHFYSGVERSRLSKSLGHSKPETLQEYIHEFDYPTLTPTKPQ